MTGRINPRLRPQYNTMYSPPHLSLRHSKDISGSRNRMSKILDKFAKRKAQKYNQKDSREDQSMDDEAEVAAERTAASIEALGFDLDCESYFSLESSDNNDRYLLPTTSSLDSFDSVSEVHSYSSPEMEATGSDDTGLVEERDRNSLDNVPSIQQDNDFDSNNFMSGLCSSGGAHSADLWEMADNTNEINRSMYTATCHSIGLPDIERTSSSVTDSMCSDYQRSRKDRIPRVHSASSRNPDKLFGTKAKNEHTSNELTIPTDTRVDDTNEDSIGVQETIEERADEQHVLPVISVPSVTCASPPEQANSKCRDKPTLFKKWMKSPFRKRTSHHGSLKVISSTETENKSSLLFTDEEDTGPQDQVFPEGACELNDSDSIIVNMKGSSGIDMAIQKITGQIPLNSLTAKSSFMKFSPNGLKGIAAYGTLKSLKKLANPRNEKSSGQYNEFIIEPTHENGSDEFEICLASVPKIGHKQKEKDRNKSSNSAPSLFLPSIGEGHEGDGSESIDQIKNEEVKNRGGVNPLEIPDPRNEKSSGQYKEFITAPTHENGSDEFEICLASVPKVGHKQKEKGRNKSSKSSNSAPSLFLPSIGEGHEGNGSESIDQIKNEEVKNGGDVNPLEISDPRNEKVSGQYREFITAPTHENGSDEFEICLASVPKIGHKQKEKDRNKSSKSSNSSRSLFLPSIDEGREGDGSESIDQIKNDEVKNRGGVNPLEIPAVQCKPITKPIILSADSTETEEASLGKWLGAKNGNNEPKRDNVWMVCTPNSCAEDQPEDAGSVESLETEGGNVWMICTPNSCAKDQPEDTVIVESLEREEQSCERSLWKRLGAQNKMKRPEPLPLVMTCTLKNPMDDDTEDAVSIRPGEEAKAKKAAIRFTVRFLCCAFGTPRSIVNKASEPATETDFHSSRSESSDYQEDFEHHKLVDAVSALSTKFSEAVIREIAGLQAKDDVSVSSLVKAVRAIKQHAAINGVNENELVQALAYRTEQRESKDWMMEVGEATDEFFDQVADYIR